VADKTRRTNYRKVKQTSVNPGDVTSVAIPPLEGGPLPGEAGPLEFTPDRKSPAVTEAEALGVLRRREAVQLASVYAESDPQALADAELPPALEQALCTMLPSALPGWDSKTKPTSFRLPERLLALLAAKAELEGMRVNALVEHVLWEVVHQPVRDPASAATAYEQMKQRTVMAERIGLHD